MIGHRAGCLMTADGSADGEIKSQGSTCYSFCEEDAGSGGEESEDDVNEIVLMEEELSAAICEIEEDADDEPADLSPHVLVHSLPAASPVAIQVVSLDACSSAADPSASTGDPVCIACRKPAPPVLRPCKKCACPYHHMCQSMDEQGPGNLCNACYSMQFVHVSK